MGAFTTIATGDDLQLLTPLNEIVSSWYERRQAIGDTTVIPALAAGDDIQDHQFWQDIQDWCTAECVHFVNDGVGVSGSTITMFTAATWKNAAGIGNGFRRVTGTTPPADWTDYEDIAYSYGIIETGDMFGPWLYVDLQNALKALKQTTRSTPSGMLINKTYKVKSTTDTLAVHEGEFLAEPWHASGTFTTWLYCVFAGKYTSPENYSSERYRAGVTITGVYTFRPSTWDVYMLPTAGGLVFQDLDSLGMTENVLFKFDADATESNAASRTAINITPDNAPSRCGVATGTDMTCDCGTTSYWVFKWVFTYDS